MSEPATLPVRRVLQMDGETLAFFLVLYRTESLPKAAAEMNISLSSANRQLARLREAWADPLFVRSGLLMKATPAAARRYDRVQRVVREIEALTFDEEVQPALLKQIVRIATTTTPSRWALQPCSESFRESSPACSSARFRPTNTCSRT